MAGNRFGVEIALIEYAAASVAEIVAVQHLNPRSTDGDPEPVVVRQAVPVKARFDAEHLAVREAPLTHGGAYGIGALANQQRFVTVNKIDGGKTAFELFCKYADVPDLGSFLTGARVAIAPMSSGSGVPMKVLEAMAAALPAVVHPWAADGLVGEASDAVAVASDADGWIAVLEELLRDSAEARDLGRRGHDLWRRYYHPDRVAEQIREVVEEAAG